MNRFRIIFLAIFLTVNISYGPQSKAAMPGLVGAASIIPGLGQAINGDGVDGLAYFVTSVGLFSTNDPVAQHVGFDIWMYNMYDAWRDAGGKPSTDHNAFVNYFSNFNPANLIDPIGAPIVAVGAVAKTNCGGPSNAASSLIYYTFTGFGEEALFRGFLFPAFSSFMGVWLGAIASSALFSAVHDNSGSSDFTFRFIAGMLFSWQVHRNKYDLGKNIFAHSWYDFLLCGPLDIAPEIRKINGKYKTIPTIKFNYRF